MCTVHTQGGKCMQPAAAAAAQKVAPMLEQADLKRQQEALVGRLIAEAGEDECTAADGQDQLQQLQCAIRCTSLLCDSAPAICPACNNLAGSRGAGNTL